LRHAPQSLRRYADHILDWLITSLFDVSASTPAGERKGVLLDMALIHHACLARVRKELFHTYTVDFDSIYYIDMSTTQHTLFWRRLLVFILHPGLAKHVELVAI
jgi:hypothetical protein